jgi:hypothetical protein
VTLIVAADGSFKLPQVDSRTSLKQALAMMGAVRADDLLAVEVLWTPEEEVGQAAAVGLTAPLIPLLSACGCFAGHRASFLFCVVSSFDGISARQAPTGQAVHCCVGHSALKRPFYQPTRPPVNLVFPPSVNAGRSLHCGGDCI